MIDAAAQIFSPCNREPLRLSASAFADTVANFMRTPPSLMATDGGMGLTVEFPFGDASSLCQFIGDKDHPLHGKGLLILQRFPHEAPTEADGIRMALEFNRTEFNEHPAGYGLGSYVYVDDIICFTGFIPNLLLRDGLLPDLYYSCAGRAPAMSVRLLGRGCD
jgi:hypothetical protein